MELIKRNEKGFRIGEAHHRAVYTDHEIDLVRRLYAEGMSGNDIAAKMEMPRSYVFKILAYQCRAE